MSDDDTQLKSPTTSDQDRPSPTESDAVRHSPTELQRRSEFHTLTTRDVMKIFEEAGLPRNQRSIERYCKENKLDCYADSDEQRYYITRASVDRLIGQLKEIQARHPQANLSTPPQMGATSVADVERQRPTPMQDADAVKRTTDEKRESETAREEYEKKMKELEDKIYNLEIDKRAKDQVVTMLRDQLKDDRDHYGHLLIQNTDKLAKYSRRLGQLETEVKQLKAPDRDTTADDTDDLDDGAAIEAEFNEADTRGEDQPTRVSINEPSL